MDAHSDAIGGPLTIRHFSEITSNRSYVDHRASGTVQLLGYASGGALPSRLSTPHDRRSPWVPAKQKASNSLPPALHEAVDCAVCRLAARHLGVSGWRDLESFLSRI